MSPYAKDVVGNVLTVRIRRNQAYEVWIGAQEVIYSTLERSAFSKVYGVTKQVNGWDLLDVAEKFGEFGAAAVIDHDNRATVRLRQCPHQFNQYLLGPVSRNEDRELGG